jgi:hypothetical protein
MLVAAKAKGFGRIYEAPIKLNYQFASVTTVRSMVSIREMLVDTAAIWYRQYIIDHYRK